MGLLDNLRAKLSPGSSAPAAAPAAAPVAEDPKRSVLQVGYCPNCSTPINYCLKDGSVECPGCEQNIQVSTLMKRPSGDVKKDDADMKELLNDIRSMEGVDDAVVFLKNYFDNYDWEGYAESSIVLIPEIEAMVKSVKVKSGSKPAVWSLDFDSVSVPLLKKIDALTALEDKMSAVYSDMDNTDLMDLFDTYKAIVRNLVVNKDVYLKRLASAVENAQSLGLENIKVKAMNDTLASIVKVLDAMKEVKDIYDVAALDNARKELDKKKVAELKAKGIDADAVYAQAMEALNKGRVGWSKALDLFISIRGYKDSVKHIRKIDRFYVFNKEIIFVSEKPFVLVKREAVVAPVDASAKGKKDKKKEGLADEEFTGETFELFPIVDQEPAGTAMIKKITDLICVHATELFYIKNKKQLCSFNTESGVETVIDEAGGYVLGAGNVWYNKAGDKIYVRKKIGLTKEKLGCFKSLFKKAQFIKHVNNYSLVEINLSKKTATPIVPEIVDVYQFSDENLFYTFAEEKIVSSAKGQVEKETISRLMVINLATRKTSSVLDENCDIHEIYGNKVVYSHHTPNYLNKELRVYDLETNTDSVIEENIYEFIKVIKGKLFYTVGNANYRPLFSNSFDGTDRVEIVANIKSIDAIRANWIYVLKGSGANLKLVKISHDGQKVISLCYGLKEVLKLTDSYVYYTNYYNELCETRLDGKETRVIASNIDANRVIVENDYVFYLRKEKVEYDRYAYSLYRMDLNGHNVRKLSFDVIAMQNYDEEKLYISKKEIARYEITIPEAKGKSHKEYITRTLKKVIEYNKISGEFTDVRVMGRPSKTEYEFKKGCFGKTEKVSSTYVQIPAKPTYDRGLEQAGNVFDEQVREAQMAEAAKKNK